MATPDASTEQAAPTISDPSSESAAKGFDEPVTTTAGAGQVLRPLAVLLLLFVFLVGVQALSTGIKGLGKDTLDLFMTSVRSPFAGLVSGILATTLVQSSSVTTSLVVGMVAGGVLPLNLAVPVIMGANIGTTVTNTIAAMAQVGHRTELRRAFAAATCHDFFNYMTVLVLLPLEIATGYLAKASVALDSVLPTFGGVAYKSPFKLALKACVGVMKDVIALVSSDKTLASALLAVLAVALIFGALALIVRVMKSLVFGRVERFINRFFNRGVSGGLASMSLGAVLTVLVQSSSITTSLMVPLAGAGLVRLWQVFPVTVGANIGTTVTALLASMAVSGEHADAARQIALAHLLFNLTGTLLFYVPKRTRRWSMKAAVSLAKVASRNRRWALIYVLGAFYGLPALLLLVGQLF